MGHRTHFRVFNFDLSPWPWILKVKFKKSFVSRIVYTTTISRNHWFLLYSFIYYREIWLMREIWNTNQGKKNGKIKIITIGSIHFIPHVPGIYPYGVSLLTPIHFHVPRLIFSPLVAKYLAENGVSGTFWKTTGSINSIPGIYPHGVSFLTPIHFCVPILIFGHLVAKYLAENGVSGTSWKNYWLNSVFSWRIPTCVAHDCK